MLKQGHIYGEVGTLERQLDPVWDLRPCPQEADGPAGEMTPVLPLPALGMASVRVGQALGFSGRGEIKEGWGCTGDLELGGP